MNKEVIKKEEGRRYGVYYVTYYGKMRYIIVDNPDISWDDIMTKYVKDFIIKFVPKFGKYEVEEFIGRSILEALLITKDITDLYNLDLVCNDFPYNITKVNKEDICEACAPCFKVISVKDGVTKLMFKWKPYEELR